MPTFSSFQNILPDPNNKIGDAGQASASGSAGAGFASVSFTSDQKTLKDFTNSGRLLARARVAHKWRIKIMFCNSSAIHDSINYVIYLRNKVFTIIFLF